MAKYTNEPRLTVSKFADHCSETGNQISKGQEVLYKPRTGQVFCSSSEEYKLFTKKK